MFFHRPSDDDELPDFSKFGQPPPAEESGTWDKASDLAQVSTHLVYKQQAKLACRVVSSNASDLRLVLASREQPAVIDLHLQCIARRGCGRPENLVCVHVKNMMFADLDTCMCVRYGTRMHARMLLCYRGAPWMTDKVPHLTLKQVALNV